MNSTRIAFGDPEMGGVQTKPARSSHLAFYHNPLELAAQMSCKKKPDSYLIKYSFDESPIAFGDPEMGGVQTKPARSSHLAFYHNPLELAAQMSCKKKPDS